MEIQKYKAKIKGTDTEVVGYISETREQLGQGTYGNGTEYLISVTEKSMLLWIVSNKQMSLSRKIYKFWIYLVVQFADYFRQGSQCTLICAFYEPQPSHFQKLLRRSELLMKKGYKVRLKLSLSEKQIELLDSESAQLLTQLINQLMLQKGLLWI